MKTTILLAILLVPMAAALPATCADPCAITARSEGYVAPAATVASGTTITFVNGDGVGHVTADGTGVGGAASCFSVSDKPVTLTIQGAALVATVGGVTKTCASATALPDGSFALPFYCKIHTNMRGALVVG